MVQTLAQVCVVASAECGKVLRPGLLLHACSYTHCWWLHNRGLPCFSIVHVPCCAGEMSGVNSAVVYAGMRYAADALAAQLGRAGITAASYHAGLDYNTRERVQVREALLGLLPASASLTGVSKAKSHDNSKISCPAGAQLLLASFWQSLAHAPDSSGVLLLRVLLLPHRTTSCRARSV